MKDECESIQNYMLHVIRVMFMHDQVRSDNDVIHVQNMIRVASRLLLSND